MVLILEALFPVIAVIALGHALGRVGFLREDQWATLDRSVYFIFFPALLFSDLSRAQGGAADALSLAAAAGIAQGSMAALLLLARPRLGIDGPSFTSVFQGAVRFNSFVALALAGNLAGDAGRALAAIGVAVMVPMSNVLSVYVLGRYAQARRTGLSEIFALLIRNPLLLGCLGGIAAQLFPPLPAPVLKTAAVLGAAALPIGLLVVGAGLDIRAVHREGALVLLASALKLLAAPALSLGISLALGITGVALDMTMLLAAVPGATMSYVLARQMNGNAPLMANIITATTLGAIVTLPCALLVARSLN